MEVPTINNKRQNGNNSKRNNRKNGNNSKRNNTYNSKKDNIINYNDDKYQNIDLKIEGKLNKDFTLTPEINNNLTSLNNVIQETINLKVGSNCTMDEFRQLLQYRICDKKMIILKNSECAHGGFKLVLTCGNCDYVYMFDFKKIITAPGDDIFMQGGLIDLSDLDNIMLSGPSYFRPVIINTTKTTTPNIRFDFMIARNCGIDVHAYYAKYFKEYFDYHKVNKILIPKNNKSYLLSVCILLTLLYSISLLHERNVFHCDIKNANVLIGNDINPITLIDFGLSVNDNEDLFPKTNYKARGTPEHFTKTIIGLQKPKNMNTLTLLDYKDMDLHSIGFTSLFVLTGQYMYDIVIKKRNPYKRLDIYNKLDILYNDGIEIINDMFEIVKQPMAETKLKIINIMEKLSQFGFHKHVDGTNQAKIIYDELLEIVRGDPDLKQEIQQFLKEQQLKLNPAIIF